MFDNDNSEDDYHVNILKFLRIHHDNNNKNISSNNKDNESTLSTNKSTNLKLEKSLNQIKSTRRNRNNNLIRNETNETSYFNQSNLNSARRKQLTNSSSFNRSINSGNSTSIKPDLNDPFWAFNSQSIDSQSFLTQNKKSSKNSKPIQINNTLLNSNRKNKSNTSFLIFDSNFKTDSNNKLTFKKSSKDIDIDKLINNIDKSSNSKNNTNNNQSSKWLSNNQIFNEDESFASDSICSAGSSSSNEDSIEDFNFLSNNKSKNNRKKQNNNNDLFDIVERENTDFSTKFAYDKMQGINSLSPHTYLDLVMDPTLKFSRQNTFRLRPNRNNNNNPTTPSKFYHDLTQPTTVNLYSELNLNDQSIISNKINKSNRLNKSLSLKSKSSKPINTNSQKQLNKSNKNISFSELLASSFDIVVDEHVNTKPTKNDYTESYIFNDNIDPLLLNVIDNCVSAVALFASGQTQSLVSQSSESNSTTAPTISTSFRINDSIKETPIIPKPEFQKNNLTLSTNKSKNASSKNKTIVKEFKYCILTDLKIGEGEFSETFQGYRYDRGAPIKIAGKRLKNFKDKDDQTALNFLSEIAVLSQLGKHDHVIEYLGVNTFNNSMYMIFEFAEKGDLKRLLDSCRKNSKKDINITNLYKLKIGYEVASGMDYISSLDIVHKDLAARNILLDKDYNCKISDFGCCKSEFLNKRPIRYVNMS
jgi:hypothetical protein